MRSLACESMAAYRDRGSRGDTSTKELRTSDAPKKQFTAGKLSADLVDVVGGNLPTGAAILSDPDAARPMIVRLATGAVARVFVWTLTGARAGTGRPGDEHKIQLKLPGQRAGKRGSIGRSSRQPALILGYSPELAVVAAWEPRHYREFSFNRNVQIPHHVLEAAHARGWACAPVRRLQSGAEARVACRLEHVHVLLDTLLTAERQGLHGADRAHLFALRESELCDASPAKPARTAHAIDRSGDGAPTVPIRPQVRMYSAFSRLSYQPWFAIAEFVDNALQSYLANRKALAKADGKGRPLKVEVRIEDGLIRVSDNAAGIATGEMGRAFSPAAPPEDSTGLSEFGIGLKAAACWLCEHWTVRTTALGETKEREIKFDVKRVVEEEIEELPVAVKRAKASEHYTVVDLTRLRAQPKTRTITKIREHLAGIYREFLRDGDLELRFVTNRTEEALEYVDRPLLTARDFRTAKGKRRRWRKDIHIDLGGGRVVRGWAGLLEKGSTARAGFAILRRRRLVQGSADEGWRPLEIFKAPNKATYQRLVGELHVEGFNVSHTKDGIQWEEAEEDLLHKLKLQLDQEPLPLLKQAEGHRVSKPAAKLEAGFGQEAVDSTSQALESSAPAILDQQLAQPAPDPKPRAALRNADEVLAKRVSSLKLRHEQTSWDVKIEIVRDRSQDWYTVVPIDTKKTKGKKASKSSRRAKRDETPRREIEIRLNLDHPFSEAFVNEDRRTLDAVVRIVVGLSLAEQTARDGGTTHAGRVRRHLNQLLRGALATPNPGEEA